MSVHDAAQVLTAWLPGPAGGDPGGPGSRLVEPRNPYAASKLMVDLMLPAEATAFGLSATRLRYFNAAGAVDELGERHDPESHLIPIVPQVAAGRREQLQMYGNDHPTPDGTCVRDYIHVADLAAAHVLALEAIEPGRHGIYNLGNGNTNIPRLRSSAQVPIAPRSRACSHTWFGVVRAHHGRHRILGSVVATDAQQTHSGSG
jgi:nucleoside-diphosphate-sugar epimerase